MLEWRAYNPAFFRKREILTDLELLVNNKLEALDFKEGGLKLCVACSAGLDSTVLLHLLRKISEKKPQLSLGVCHVNYGLRGEDSEGDEAFLKQMAGHFKLPFFSYKPSRVEKIHGKKVGVQAWARKERYRFFEKLAASGWQLVLAHTKDDLLETILQRLLRGTSPLAARGMSEKHKFYWRPLLEVEKLDLHSWALENGVSWREDVSNTSRVYSRNKLRLDVIPELEKIYPGSKGRVIRFAEQSQDLAVFARETLRTRAVSFVEKKKDSLSVELSFFEGLTRGLVSLFLADLLRELAGESYVPEDKLLGVLYEWVSGPAIERPQRQLARDMFCKTQENKLIFEKL